MVLFKGSVIDKRRTEFDSLNDVIGRGFSGWIYIYPAVTVHYACIYTETQSKVLNLSRGCALSLYLHRDTERSSQS